MPDITDLLDAALSDEPAQRMCAKDIAESGRRQAWRRRAAAMASAACATGVGVVIAVAALDPGGQATTPAAGEGTQRPTASASAPSTAGGTTSTSGTEATTVITEDTLPGIVERELDADLVEVDSSSLPSDSDVNLAAGIARLSGRPARNQYLNVQVTGAHSLVVDPTCAQLSGDGENGDGYVGPCEVRRLPAGGWLVVRTAATPEARYRITEAVLIRPDGSGISAETTNQAVTPRSQKVAKAPVVSAEPPVAAEQLSRLVIELATLPVRF